MYSFAQREDTCVYDEPLYGYYLKNTDADEYHPDADLIMKSMECDGQKVVDMMLGEHDRPIVFFKNMTHHLLHLNKDFLKYGVNIILTRDPREMLPSFHKVIPDPQMKDVGYQAHLDLVNYCLENQIEFMVIESAQILKDPPKGIRDLCEKAGINFDEAMLSWPMGPRPEDGVWAPHWYASIHNSTGFKPYQLKEDPFPEELKPLLEECLPIFDRIMKYSDPS
jgi:hypothetical protein